jgi:hypothetical protein
VPNVEIPTKFSNIIEGEGIPINHDVKPRQGEKSILKIYQNGHGMAVKESFSGNILTPSPLFLL